METTVSMRRTYMTNGERVNRAIREKAFCRLATTAAADSKHFRQGETAAVQYSLLATGGSGRHIQLPIALSHKGTLTFDHYPNL